MVGTIVAVLEGVFTGVEVAPGPPGTVTCGSSVILSSFKTISSIFTASALVVSFSGLNVPSG